MPSFTDSLGDLRLGDLSTFLAVRHAGSIAAAARELSVTPSQVSKAISRLESTLGVQVLSRGSRGVGLSEAGLRVLPHVEAAVARLLAAGRADGESSELRVAAPSYLLAQFVPVIEAGLHDRRVRGLELPPALLRAYSGEDVFDVCLIPGNTDRLPHSWSTVPVGHIERAVFATPALAERLGAQPVTVDRLRSVPFVSPVYYADGHIVPADDDGPVARNERVVGHQVLSIVLALELAARTSQLVFGPCIAATPHLAAGSLVKVRVRGWQPPPLPLFVACNGDRVRARVLDGVAQAVRKSLADAT